MGLSIEVCANVERDLLHAIIMIVDHARLVHLVWSNRVNSGAIHAVGQVGVLVVVIDLLVALVLNGLPRDGAIRLRLLSDASIAQSLTSVKVKVRLVVFRRTRLVGLELLPSWHFILHSRG